MKEVICMSKLDKRVEDAKRALTQTLKKFDEYRKHVEELNKKEESKNENYNNV
jgi:hypothetical protein